MQDARRPGLETLPGAGLGISIESLRTVAPAQLVVHARHLPGTLRGDLSSEDRLELARERGALHEHALLAVEPGGARIEVVAADEQRPPVYGERLGVQARTGGPEHARLDVLTAEGLELPDLHAALDQRLAIARIAAVHRSDVIRDQRVRQHAHAPARADGLDPGGGHL